MSEEVVVPAVTDDEFRSAGHMIVAGALAQMLGGRTDPAVPRLPRADAKGLVQRDADGTGAFVEVSVWVPNDWARRV